MLVAGIGRIEGGITRPVPDEVLVRAAAYAIEAGNGVNTANLFGLTAVHGAAANESDGLIQFLAQKGARVDTKDREGTPADFADGLLIDNSNRCQELGATAAQPDFRGAAPDSSKIVWLRNRIKSKGKYEREKDQTHESQKNADYGRRRSRMWVIRQ